MAIGSFIDLTAEQAKQYSKSLRKYQGTKSSIIAKPYKILSREEISARKTRQWLSEIAAAWKLLDTGIKFLWKTYAQNIHRTGWALYCQEYAYRKKYGLSYPPLPTELHQMYGLQISNPDGLALVSSERFDISLTGPITISFDFKKIERAETSGMPFHVFCEAVYFENGANLSDTYDFQADPGTLEWEHIEFTYGQNDKYYFEHIVSFIIDEYNADVVIDNFKITDSIGVVVDEPWHIKAGKTWYYQVRTRKQGWQFEPTAGYPNIAVVYTGD